MQRRPRPDLVWAITGALAVVALLGVWRFWSWPTHPGATTVSFWVILAAFIIGELLLVEINVTIKGGINTSLAEVPAAYFLLVASPKVFIGARFLATVVALLLTMRDPTERDWMKFSFNVAMMSTTAVVGVGLHRAMLGNADPVGLRGWVALALALIIADALALAVLGVVFRLVAPGTTWREILRRSLFSTAATSTLTFVGLFLAVATWHDPALLWVDAFALGGIYWLMRIYGRLQAEYATLNNMYEFSRELTTSTNVLGGATASLRHGARMMNAVEGMLFVPWADKGKYWVLAESGEVEHLPISSDTAMAVADLLLGRETRLVDLRGAKSDGAVVLRDKGYMTVIMAAVVGPGGTGWVAFKQERQAMSEAQTSALIASVAGQCAAAIGRTSAHDKLLHELDRKTHAAAHDKLTGLPNRDHFLEHLTGVVNNPAGANEGEAAVLLIGLDRFKEVNESFGHKFGDYVLQEVGNRLRTNGRSGEFLARLDGDEFAILVQSSGATEHAVELARRVGDLLAEPVKGNDVTILVGGSIGISLWPRHGRNPDDLMRWADQAMHSAKRDDHIQFFLYEQESEKDWLRRTDVLRSLRGIDLGDEIEVWFQPKVDLATGRPVGSEALARWHHPKLGAVSPAEFIPIAEQSGLIRPLTEAVLAKALPSLAATFRAGHDLTLAVNLSGRALIDVEIVNQVAAALKHHNIPPERLTIEITESVFVNDSQRLNEVLNSYEELGVKISIDDFGTGYSSLSYLRRLPARELKIDRSFVDGMVHDGSKFAIVKSTVALAHDLDMIAVGEGIEDVETMALLRSIGCDIGQGYLMARPMPLDDYLAWLKNPTIPRNFELDKAHLLHRAPPLSQSSLRDN